MVLAAQGMPLAFRVKTDAAVLGAGGVIKTPRRS